MSECKDSLVCFLFIVFQQVHSLKTRKEASKYFQILYKSSYSSRKLKIDDAFIVKNLENNFSVVVSVLKVG